MSSLRKIYHQARKSRTVAAFNLARARKEDRRSAVYLPPGVESGASYPTHIPSQGPQFKNPQPLPSSWQTPGEQWVKAHQLSPCSHSHAGSFISGSKYVAAHRPQVQISPAPGRGSWKSPDVDVVGPAGTNRIAKGLKHRIVARIRNAGSLGAKWVRVSFAWLPFTTSPGTWTELGAAPLQDVAAFSSATFAIDWNVPASMTVNKIEVEHFCVRVTIDRYVDPFNPSQSEIVIVDNWAQSNFDTQDVDHGSPSARRWTAVTVSNPTFSEATYRVLPASDSEHFRVFVGHAWLQLRRDETRAVPVAYESLAGDPVQGDAFDRAFREGAFEQPAQISFNAFVIPPDADQCASASVVWGAGLALRPGRRTRLDDVGRRGEGVRGWVRSQSGGVTTDVTQGDVRMVVWTGRRPDDQLVLSAPLEATGRFTLVLPKEILAAIESERVFADVIYLGSKEYAQSRTGPIPLV
jgi:hypothetical protein